MKRMRRGRRMPILRDCGVTWLLLFLPALVVHAADDHAARVILLANSDDPDSVRIALHYAEARRVPAANIVALKMPRAEEIAWREFISAIWQPLIDQLVAARWIDAQPMALTDSIGRRKFAPHGHRIAALVVCRGVPLKISHDAALFAEVPPLTSRPELRTNAGAVDSELSLLPLPNYLINALQRNPLFQNDRPGATDLDQIVKVSRLDGPEVEDALALVDRAIAAERTGLAGRAYVDLSDRDPAGNEWLQSAVGQLAELGFDTAVDREPATFPVTARFDAPVLYFGWYAADVTGPFTLPGFRFAPGAIALHIHSYSAASLRSRDTGWTGALVARGVTATFGNVYEPYLQFTHRPDLLLRALARGHTLVDAAYYALPALSWQAVVIGDPLFRPFAVDLEEQSRNRPGLPPAMAAYVTLRQIARLDAGRRSDEATKLAIAAQRESPSLAVGMELARRLRRAGDNQGAGAALAFAANVKTFDANDWALAREAAGVLGGSGRHAAAIAVWRALLNRTQNLPRPARLAWLPAARDAALAANESAQAQAWENELTQLSTAER